VTRLDEALPEYEFVERHHTLVAASPERALAAAQDATPAEMPLVRTLFTVRSLPARLTRGGALPADPARSLAAQMVAFGFVLLAKTEREVVFGYVGQPWRLTGGSMPRLATAREWLDFAEPGYVKAAMSFSVLPMESGTRLATETRIHATDPASRRRFARYWRVIRPGSGLIRRSWLHAAKGRAELAGSDTTRV
jgi:hypothetical protein